MPDKENKTLKLNNFNKQLPTPYVIYADFEAIIEKIQTCTPEQNQSYTEHIRNTQILDMVIGSSVVMMINLVNLRKYTERNAVYKFMKKMLREAENCKLTAKKHLKKPLKNV